MPRNVHFFRPTWEDRDFRKALRRFTEDEREERLREIAELIAALAECAHPQTDPRLARWRPSAYHVPNLRQAQLFEYRCRYPLRVIARWIAGTRAGDEAVLMLCATLAHDHKRLGTILRNNRREIGAWGPDEG